jgi:hypothetical protein
LLKHADLQFDFPSFVRPPTPQWMLDFAKFLDRIAPYMRPVFWIAVIAGAAFLIYLIVQQIMKHEWKFSRRRKEDPAAASEWRLAPEVARNLLREADALAAQGRYGDAVHLLLLRSIEHIDERKPDLVRPALTSREIATLDQLPGIARTAFIGMARVVERALFAHRDVGQSDFLQCREAYERFAFPGVWEGAR